MTRPTTAITVEQPSTALWTVEETSAFLRTPVGTLYQWRHRRKGPPAAKIGRHLLYDPADVRAWFQAQKAA